MNLLEAAKMAHEALYHLGLGKNHRLSVMAVLSEAIAEAEKCEPVAWRDTVYGNLHHSIYGAKVGYIPLYTTPQPAIPAGWQLVPVEPTPEMKNAAWGSNVFGRTNRYKAMLAAAPKHE